MTWSRNRATMCFLRPFLPLDPHITIACINNFYIHIPRNVNILICFFLYSSRHVPFKLDNRVYISREGFTK